MPAPAIPSTHRRLCLVRKEGEMIIVGDDRNFIAFTVEQAWSNRVTISVVAPANVRVLRDELLENPPIERGSR